MPTVDSTVDSAACWFPTLGPTSQSQLMAYSAAADAGTRPGPIVPDEAEAPRGHIGDGLAGCLQFQPIRERISTDHPDLFG